MKMRNIVIFMLLVFEIAVVVSLEFLDYCIKIRSTRKRNG